jgi:hypothetical protein
MTYKYVCLGLFNPKNAGKISWFHDSCALQFNGTGAGGKAEKTEDKPPENAKCVFCGHPIVEEKAK